MSHYDTNDYFKIKKCRCCPFDKTKLNQFIQLNKLLYIPQVHKEENQNDKKQFRVTNPKWDKKHMLYDETQVV